MKTLNLTIIESDVSEGVQCNVSKCAIARGFARMFDGLQVYVGRDSMSIHDKINGILHIPLNETAQRLVALFDQYPKELHKHVIPLPLTIPFEMPDDIYEKVFGAYEQEDTSVPETVQQDKGTDIVQVHHNVG